MEAFLNGATAVDNIDGVVEAFEVLGTPSFFPLGETGVSFFAVDNTGNTGTATEKITVVGRTSPVITVPSDIVVEAFDSNGVPIADANI